MSSPNAPGRGTDEGQKDQARRLTATEIFENVVENGREELQRPNRALAFSGLAAGITMGLSGLGAATVLSVLGRTGPAEIAAAAVYPLGFIAVIIGRAQLFTENTLYPVVVVLDDRRHLLDTIQLWAIVLATNAIGALGFALLASKTTAIPTAIVDELNHLGAVNAAGTFVETFWSAVVGGWIIALVAWVVAGTQGTIGQIAIIWLLTFLVGLGRLDHSVATAGEVFTSASGGVIGWGLALRWFAAAVLGNVVGGVVIVSLLNYGQVRVGDHGD